MPRDTKEPQSYGSGSDWVTGRTGETVNPPASAPAPEHRPFYDDRRESESSAPAQGGLTSDVQFAESAMSPAPSTVDESESVPKVSTRHGGAKRDSYFRKRDYES